MRNSRTLTVTNHTILLPRALSVDCAMFPGGQVFLSVTKQTAPSLDVLGNILKKLTAKRSRARVVDKLLSIGLVSDRRQLYKKRSRGAQGKSSGRGMVRLNFIVDAPSNWVTTSMCAVRIVKVNDNSVLYCYADLWNTVLFWEVAAA